MTFRDLQEALTRLENDPRIHPTTPIDIAYHKWDAEAKCWYDVMESLCAIALDGHRLVFATVAHEPALAR